MNDNTNGGGRWVVAMAFYIVAVYIILSLSGALSPR